MKNGNREFRKVKSLDFLYEVNSNGTLSLHPLTERERRRVAGIMQGHGNHRRGG